VFTGAAGVARMIGNWPQYNQKRIVCILSEDCEDINEKQYKCPMDVLSTIPIVNYYFKSRKYKRGLKQLLRERHFDVIIYHNAWLAYGARQMFRKLQLHTAIIAFIHDDNTLDMPDGFIPGNAAFGYLVRWFMERAVVPRLDRVLTNSEYLKGRVEETFHLKNTVRKLYYTAHDYPELSFRSKTIDPTKPVRILFAKSDFIRGGLQDLLSALELLNHYRFDLTIAGPPKQRVLRKINPTLLQLNNVTINYPGRVKSWPEMIALYHAHDLLCVPSRREALGLANAEALACGTPVVTTTAGGIPEVMNNGMNGYLCKPGDIEDLATKIRQCMTDFAQTAKQNEAGRAFVLERFNINTMFHTLDAILAEIVKHKLVPPQG